MNDFNVLQRLLTNLAAEHGDGVEVTSRRGTDMVGISIYSLSGGYSSIHNEWMEDLDGLMIEKAYSYALSIAFANEEKLERSKNEK